MACNLQIFQLSIHPNYPAGVFYEGGYYPAPAVISDDVPESLFPAVELLSKHGLILVEYGQRALPKYGYPLVVSVSHSSLLPLLVHELC